MLTGLMLAVVSCLPSWAAAPNAPAEPVQAFFGRHCYDCHQGEAAEGGLDLTRLDLDLANAKTEARWVRIFDRVEAGEMPPPDTAQVEPRAAAEFLRATGDWLRGVQQARIAEKGRVQGRRLTRRELERTIQDLLGIDIPLADQLPEESSSAEFTTVASGQSISHFQLERHLTVVDVALDEAFRRALTPEDQYHRDFSARQVARQSPNRRNREPEMIDDKAVVWSSGLIFYGRLPATTAPESGWYRFKAQVSGLKLPATGGVWCTVRSGLCVSSAPLLAWIDGFEATEQPKEIAFEAWLPKRHMIEIRPGDVTLKKARFAGGQVGVGEGDPQNVPGIAIHRLSMQRIHRGPGDDEIRGYLFGDLELKPADSRGQRFKPVSKNPRRDIERLVAEFAHRAFRRPVTDDELAPYLALAREAWDQESDLVAALRVGYRALMCSPRFLYLTEAPGALDDYAVATRLSYFLTGSMPDAELSRLADAGRLRDAATRRAQVERLLAGPRGRQFVQDFAAEWLELNQIDFTEPDRKVVPDFDPLVQSAMLDETHTYLETMLRDNLSVAHLIRADFTFLNSRLARFYGIDGVVGDELRRVVLGPEQRRGGGLLTQGAIMKVTANGSTTSPVIRGVWVSERLLGTPIPPPPENVPAVEPDIRGATTIREMLAKHRSQASCAGCHTKIDPPGFALENFDPAGRWRDRYVQLNGSRVQTGAKIDPSYIMPDGQEFRDLDEFRSLVVANPRKLAHNLAEKLIVYGTGEAVSFADRAAVDAVVDQAAQEDFGFRSIIHAVASSPLFLSK